MPPGQKPIPSPDVDDTLGTGDSAEDFKHLQDLVASTFYGASSYNKATGTTKNTIRIWLNDFFVVAGNVNGVRANIKNDTLTLTQERVLKMLYENREILDTFTQNYVDVINSGELYETDDLGIERIGYDLEALVTQDYDQYLARENAKRLEDVNPHDYIQDQINLMSGGGDFKAYFDHLDAYKQITDKLLRPGKFRRDTAPVSVARWQCRIGASTFFVPPTQIRVHQAFQSGSLTNGVLRQPNSPKTNLGHSQTEITLTLYFPNHETIWGFAGDKPDFDIFNWDPMPDVNTERDQVQDAPKNGTLVPDIVIDRYLSSLRGLVTQFKYAPFLPIKNEYLNRTYDINAVTMVGMTVATVPDFPFVLAVNLVMNKFNFAPFLPMIDDFDQAIHWGKYRQYMGKAAARLDAKVNQGFLIEIPDVDLGDKPADQEAKDNGTAQNTLAVYEGDLIPRFDKVKDIEDGRNFEFYFPITTPSRIFAPDTTDFRQPGEDLTVTKDTWDFLLKSIGLDVVEPPTFSFFEFDKAYRNARYRSERKVLLTWLKSNKILADQMGPTQMNAFLDATIANGRKTVPPVVNDSNEDAIRAMYKNEWFNQVYELLLENNPAFVALKKSKQFLNTKYTINEWNVPMEKLLIDWTHCIVNNVTVSLSNNFATLQVQLQDEPTYQHIGGGDSRIQVSMTVIGEDNLLRLRRLFDHINGLARLEKVHGVLGFLGIKNVITALLGIKYVLPEDFEIETVPNFPHVYTVNLSFIDFDIMQQERETLSSSQQQELVNLFGKRNPFLRLKQAWGAFNAYPDLPLDVRDDTGSVLGHLDPDWYFRSFTTIKSDDDLFNWGFEDAIAGVVRDYTELKQKITDGYYRVDSQLTNANDKLAALEKQLRDYMDSGSSLPAGWEIVDGHLVTTNVLGEEGKPPEPEYTQYLGLYDNGQKNLSFIEFYAGGYFALGTKDVATGEKKYAHGMASFQEDLASANLKGVQSVKGTTPLSEYQHEYFDGATNPNRQYEAMMQDFNYRNMRGRMLKAFPTYMLWLIDEGGRFAGIKLFDNFYGLNSVVDFSVVQSEDAIGDTLVMRLSNIYQKLTTPYKDAVITEDDPLFDTPIGRWISISQNRARNLESGLTNEIIELANIRLKPGVRIHLRMGYGANPNGLQTVFNGVIAEVQPGDIMTIIAQADAVEFTGFVNTVNQKGSSGKLDGGINTGFWMSEPRDLIVRLLTIGSSNFKEWFAYGSKGVFFSDSRFGIRHFGNILYESMTSTEDSGQRAVQAAAQAAQNGTEVSSDGMTGLLGDFASDLSAATSITSLPGAISGNMVSIMKMIWLNSFSKRDYEIFKRNVYPGNGSGIAQFMGGDQIDAGVTIATASAYYAKDSGGTAYYKYTKPEERVGVKTANDAGAGPRGIPHSGTDSDPAVQNEKVIDSVWQQYNGSNELTEDELIELLSDPANVDTGDIDVWNHDPGLFEQIIGLGKKVAVPIEIMIGGPADALLLIQASGRLIGGLGRLAHGLSPLTTALGITSAFADDDLDGFDEVSFRAQTYMKTVWDLFNLCAALLPNYIVAVRPFEDRSTLFYGKPHWLYTSGVVPITLGVPKDLTALPHIEGADQIASDIMQHAKDETGKEFERMMTVVDNTGSLKDIMSFTVGKDVDPNDASGDLNTNTDLTSADDLDGIVKQWQTQLKDAESGYSDKIIDVIKGADSNKVTATQFNEVLEEAFGIFHVLDDTFITDIDASTEDLIAIINDRLGDLVSGTSEELDDGLSLLDQFYYYTQNDKDDPVKHVISEVTIKQNLVELAPTAEEQQKLLDFYERDPITFAYQFGWKFNTISPFYDPATGYGVDTVGSAARKIYDKDYGGATAQSSERSLLEATDIWHDFRIEARESDWAKEIYQKHFPNDEDQDAYNRTWDLFLRFMWQDPFNRAWIVLVSDKESKWIPHGGNQWHWESEVGPVWEFFLTGSDVTINDQNQVIAPRARAYMEANIDLGNDSNTKYGAAVGGIKDWYDNNVAAVIGLITDTMTGFVATIRNSLAQMGNALSQAGQLQKQANILNSAFNDSIYYQAGSPGSLMRLVDNPFTREYGEPVVEIREPFQRIHYVGSFGEILDNKISENLNDVATVVTAVSDGKYPVTVHFDKGISPERQVERVVETGLLWDNAVGAGLFGFLQPLLHPLESLRGYAKGITGSSDQLSSRRVALWHLKQNLKNIYMGEILLLGDADIRPYDLLYIADVYERMYGLVEVQQVIHHFTPETGFVTAVTPNAVVTINDPVRWTLLSYVGSKMHSYNIRDDVRAYMNIKADRNVAAGGKEILSDDLYKYFGTQMNGSVQHTQGTTALIRDIGAVFTGGGIKGLRAQDDAINQIAKIDLGLGLLKSGATVLGAVGGGLVAGPQGVIVGGVGAWAVTDLVWEAWQWVKSNLLDQHGCYIQYLNKDGQAMDAGLSYASGVAVGTNHTVSLFPSIMGLNGRVTVKEDGHYRITTNDLLGSLGWTEVETVSLYRETSMFVNKVNKDILSISGRDPVSVPNDNFIVVIIRILDPDGENINGDVDNNGIEDGDTLNVQVASDTTGTYKTNEIIRVRLSAVNAAELQYHDSKSTAFNEALNNPIDDLGRLAYEYLKSRFAKPADRYVAMRVNKRDEKDSFGRTLGVIFHNVPQGTPPANRIATLRALAERQPPIPFDAYLEDGRPYTLNWEMVMTGYGNIDMRESLWNTSWRNDSLNQGTL